MLRPIAVLSVIGLLSSACATSRSAPGVPSSAPDGGPRLQLPGEGPAPAAGDWTTGLPGHPAFADAGAGTAAAVAPSHRPAASDGTRHITGFLGMRELDDGGWGPVDDQVAAGAELDEYDPATGHGYEAGVTYSEDDGDAGPFDVDAYLLEFYGGYRHTFITDSPGVTPYLSAGGSLLHADVDFDGPGGGSGDDTGLGIYVRAGILFDLDAGMRLGVDYRHMLLSDIDIGGIDDADFDQILVTLGFPF